MVNVVEGMAQMGEEMIQNGLKDEAEMWREIMSDNGVMIDAESVLTSAETVQM